MTGYVCSEHTGTPVTARAGRARGCWQCRTRSHTFRTDRLARRRERQALASAQRQAGLLGQR